LKPSALKFTKNELLDVDEHILLRLLTKVMMSKRSPNVEIKEFFQIRRPSKIQREAIVDIVFFVLHHKKRLFFSTLESNNQRNFSNVISGVLRLAMAIWISSENLPLNIRNRGTLNAFKRFELFENGFFPDYSEVSIRFSFPVWIVKYLAEKKGYENAFRALCSSKKSDFICLRVNTGKTKVGEISKRLFRKGVKNEVSPIISNCLYISNKIKVSKFDAYKEGLFEIQDFGSQLIVKLLNPKPYSMVVDFCCGAGGKSLASSVMMKNTGLIYAVDISTKRIDELKKRAKRAGVTNLCPLVVSSLEDPKIENLFQKASFVLVDVPCSGSGTFGQFPHLKWQLTREKLAEYKGNQSKILNKAASCVAQGGSLVYATCSIFEEENNTVTEEFLKKNEDFDPVGWDGCFSTKVRKELAPWLEESGSGGALLYSSPVSKYSFYFHKFVRQGKSF